MSILNIEQFDTSPTQCKVGARLEQGLGKVGARLEQGLGKVGARLEQGLGKVGARLGQQLRSRMLEL